MIRRLTGEPLMMILPSESSTVESEQTVLVGRPMTRGDYNLADQTMKKRMTAFSQSMSFRDPAKLAAEISDIEEDQLLGCLDEGINAEKIGETLTDKDKIRAWIKTLSNTDFLAAHRFFVDGAILGALSRKS